MRSPRSVCSRGSSQTAHSLPTNVLSRLVRLLSVSNIPAIPPPARLRRSLDPLLLLFRECDELALVEDCFRGDDDPAVVRGSAYMGELSVGGLSFFACFSLFTARNLHNPRNRNVRCDYRQRTQRMEAAAATMRGEERSDREIAALPA